MAAKASWTADSKSFSKDILAGVFHVPQHFPSFFRAFLWLVLVSACRRSSERDGLVVFMPDPLFKDMRLSHTGFRLEFALYFML